MCACVIRMTSMCCNCAGVSGGSTNRFGPIVRIEPIDMPTRENRVGSESARVPKKFMSRAAWPRFAIVSELSGHDAGSRRGCEWPGASFMSRGYDLAANSASENRATAAITRGRDRSRRDGWNEIEFRSEDASGRAHRSCPEGTTSRQTAPAKTGQRRRSLVAGIAAGATDGTKSNSLLRRWLEAGEFLDQHVTVGTIMPLERSDAGAERPGHRVKLFAVGNVNHVGGSVGEIFRLVGLDHLIERRIEEEICDAGLRLPAVF